MLIPRRAGTHLVAQVDGDARRAHNFLHVAFVRAARRLRHAYGPAQLPDHQRNLCSSIASVGLMFARTFPPLALAQVVDYIHDAG